MENIGTRIARYLVEKGLIQKEDLEKLLPLNQPPGDVSLEEQLVSAGLVNQEQFRSAAEEFFGVPFASQGRFSEGIVSVRSSLVPVYERVEIYPLSPDG